MDSINVIAAIITIDIIKIIYICPVNYMYLKLLVSDDDDVVVFIRNSRT